MKEENSVEGAFRKTILCGAFGVGKTAIRKRVTQGSFTDHYAQTESMSFGTKSINSEKGCCNIQFWDFSCKAAEGLLKAFFAKAEMAFVVSDVVRVQTGFGREEDGVGLKWLRKLDSYAKSDKCPRKKLNVFFIQNKCDLLEKGQTVENIDFDDLQGTYINLNIIGSMGYSAKTGEATHLQWARNAPQLAKDLVNEGAFSIDDILLMMNEILLNTENVQNADVVSDADPAMSPKRPSVPKSYTDMLPYDCKPENLANCVRQLFLDYYHPQRFPERSAKAARFWTFHPNRHYIKRAREFCWSIDFLLDYEPLNKKEQEEPQAICDRVSVRNSKVLSLLMYMKKGPQDGKSSYEDRHDMSVLNLYDGNLRKGGSLYSRLEHAIYVMEINGIQSLEDSDSSKTSVLKLSSM